MENKMMPTVNNTPAIFGNPDNGDTFVSFSPDDMAGKVLLANALTNPENKLSDHINIPIRVRDIIVKAVKLARDTNEEYKAEETVEETADGPAWTQEAPAYRDAFRTVLIDMDGHTYSATSSGIYNSVGTIYSVFGTLHFDDGLTVQVMQVQTKKGRTYTLKVIG